MGAGVAGVAGRNDMALFCFSSGVYLALWLLFLGWTSSDGGTKSILFRMLAGVNIGVLCECVQALSLWDSRCKLSLVHISSQVDLVKFFLRHLQPHFIAKTETHKGEDFRYWFAHPILMRRIIMCCRKLTRLPEAACVKIPNFLAAAYGEGTELSLEKISFSSWSSPKLPSWFWESCLTSLRSLVYIMNLCCSLGLQAHLSASG